MHLRPIPLGLHGRSTPAIFLDQPLRMPSPKGTRVCLPQKGMHLFVSVNVEPKEVCIEDLPQRGKKLSGLAAYCLTFAASQARRGKAKGHSVQVSKKPPHLPQVELN